MFEESITLAAIKPADPKVSPAEAPRLSGQCAAILDMLRRGRVSNVQMAAVALKYTSRLHDIREAGFDVRVVQGDESSRTDRSVLYRLCVLPKSRIRRAWSRSGHATGREVWHDRSDVE